MMSKTEFHNLDNFFPWEIQFFIKVLNNIELCHAFLLLSEFSITSIPGRLSSYEDISKIYIRLNTKDLQGLNPQSYSGPYMVLTYKQRILP